jgi:aspartate aminotransferase
VFATVDEGDRVLIPEPTYSLYSDLVQLAGGTPVPVRTRDDHHLDLNALNEALPGARLVVLCNPCNPTGAVFSRTELEGLAQLLSDTATLVIADEAYDEVVYAGVDFSSCLTIPALANRLIYVQTLSKTYAMTGWRLGYVMACREILDAVARVHRTFNGPVNAAVQRAAMRALRDDGTLKRPMLEAYGRRRALLLRLLKEIPGLSVRAPEGTFYAFVKYRHPMPSMEFAARLREGGVVVRAGSEFGSAGEGHLRLSFAASEDVIEEGIRRLRAVIVELDCQMERSR